MDSSDGVGSSNGSSATSSNATNTQHDTDPSRDVQGNTTATATASTALSNLSLDATANFTNPAAQRAVADAIATQQPIQLSGPVCYSMQPGQTMQDVATAFGVSVRDLTVANQVTNLDAVYPGQTISVPGPQDKTAIGSLSETYETGGRGPGTVSTGRGDLGGVSYGSYQLSTAAGRPADFFATDGAQWSAEFAGQRPGTAAFSQTWRDIAVRDPAAFQTAQHAYIERTHYDVQANQVQTRSTVTAADGSVTTPGLALSEHSRALQNVAWSSAVQHGPNNSIVANAVRDVRAAGIQDWDANFDRAVINAVYDERGRVDANGTLVHFSGSSTRVQQGVADRFLSERADAIASLDAEDASLRHSLGLTEP